MRVGFLGVKPEFQHTGIAAAMYVEHFDMATATPQTWGEMGWILETNKNMNRAMEAMGGRIVRRFRIYERPLRFPLGTPKGYAFTHMQRSDQLKASPPMFQSRFLDRFTRVHPMVPLLIYMPVIAVLLVVAVGRDGWWDAAGLLLVGYAIWTLFEYWLHRIVFHFEPEDGIGAKLHWMIHGVHHDHPNDPLRLVMPPAASVPLAILVLAALWVLFGSVHAPAVAGGFLIGYIVYDEIHYALHHHTPKTRLGKRLRELHMRHHFQDDDKGFGISAPYWDVVFRTFPTRRTEAR